MCHAIRALVLLMAATVFAAGGPSTTTGKLRVGEAAPDFTLRDQEGREVSLHEFRGQKSVVLAFYVFAFTGG